ncbi:MAG: ribonucleoside-diphosphate reductase [Zetaproteobacteria bacterium CG2_30_46_52]|nr:MAG: ribonucleoside-diphosphate reductase [Zetaproteobacteria bacterium CG2_30_46_52]
MSLSQKIIPQSVGTQTNTTSLMPLQPASEDIWDKKYRLKNKDGNAVDTCIEDTYARVATALSEVEDEDKREFWRNRFTWALANGAIPAGRIMSNAGAQEHKPATSTINCTVSGVIPDSMDGILTMVKEAGLTLKAGCGIGYEFSTLRPKGAYVSGAGAYTSGPLSFMDIYDKMCFTVSSAGGRRGAQMGTFDISHPDVIDFIKAKREDGRLRQFNLSCLITRDFMQAVKDDADWDLVFPATPHELADESTRVVFKLVPNPPKNATKNDMGLTACRVYKTIRAQRLWDVIMASTYDYAEPGFILIDEVNDLNNNWFCEDIRATNPCVTSDTWVQTSEGPRQVGQLLGKGFNAVVDGKKHATGEQGFFKTAHKDVLRLQTKEGYALRLTHDHRVRKVTTLSRFRCETEWTEAAKLQAGDKVLLNQHINAQWGGELNSDHGYLLGLLVGDGTLKKETAVISVWAERMVANGHKGQSGNSSFALIQEAERAATAFTQRGDFSGFAEISERGEWRMKFTALRDLAFKLGMSVGDKSITPAMEKESSDFYKGFLRGFFDADGSVQGNQQKGVSVRLAQSDLPCLQAVQRMLLRLGIVSTIYKNRRAAGLSMLPDGKGGQKAYPTKAQHELVITGANLEVYQQQIGFADTDKQVRLTQSLGAYKRKLNRERFIAEVESVANDGTEDVYDVQVPGINTFDGNGLHAHNCGEQPLPPYGACLLGSINLTKFVREPFTENASFDWDTYREVVSVFTRMLDNVVDINGLPLEKQREAILSKRRHGMGFLGLGSALAMLRQTYGSESSLAFTEKVAYEMAKTGFAAGLQLAEEKGPAPMMEQDFTVTAEMMLKRPEMAADGIKIGDSLKGKVLWSKYSRYMQKFNDSGDAELLKALEEKGCRFTHHSSIAPTGTISLSLANNASNGIEPSFAHHYARNVIREGKKSKEKVDVFSYELLAYRELINAAAMPFSQEEGSKLPDYFISADAVTPTQHVDIQAAAQKWVDSSISKTANVPTDFPYDDFKDIYMYAFDKGLKGCTTFRFNPEAFQGVLVKEEDLANTTYKFTLEDGTVVEAKGNEEIEYDGEMHSAANLFDALKEGYYGKF